MLDALDSALGLTVCKAAFPAIIREAETQTWTRDPFDRLIVAQAAFIGYAACDERRDNSCELPTRDMGLAGKLEPRWRGGIPIRRQEIGEEGAYHVFFCMPPVKASGFGETLT